MSVVPDQAYLIWFLYNYALGLDLLHLIGLIGLSEGRLAILLKEVHEMTDSPLCRPHDCFFILDVQGFEV